MRARALILLFVAVILAGGTAFLARSWLASQRQKDIEVTPLALQAPARSVLVARNPLARGQILRPDDMVWQTWPEGGLDKNYIVIGGPKKPETYAGWVVVNPIGGGEPMTEAKMIAPGNRGFLAAVLRPGMRAISVPVTVTSGISGFIFPGDQVDILLTYPVPRKSAGALEGQSTADKFEHKAAETVLRDVRVIAIDQRLQSKAGEAVVAHTATFEVSPKQSEVIALANEVGKLSLTLRSLVPAGATATSAAAPSDTQTASATPLPAAALIPAAQGAVLTDRSAGAVAAQKVAVDTSAKAEAPVAAEAAGSPAQTATYTIDDEISTLFPPMKDDGQQDNSVMWICKGPGLTCMTKAQEVQQQQLLRREAASAAAGAYGAELARRGGALPASGPPTLAK